MAFQRLKKHRIDIYRDPLQDKENVDPADNLIVSGTKAIPTNDSQHSDILWEILQRREVEYSHRALREQQRLKDITNFASFFSSRCQVRQLEIN